MMNKYYIVFIALIFGFMLALVRFQPLETVFNEPDQPYYHGIRGRDQVSLTFNVDWGEDFIPGILKVLEKKEIKATFFITGNWAKKFPEFVQQIQESGHEIGNHGYSHLKPTQLNKEQLISLIKKNEDLIYEITGERTELFAPPFGDVDTGVSGIAAELGYKTIMWSADTIDWQRPSPSVIVQRAVNKIEDGGIILMHPTEPSLQALSEIIDKIERRGFSFVTVSTLIDY